MRLIAALSVALALPAARADDVADLKGRVLRAAAKDPADIQKFKHFTLKAKGKSFLGPEPLDGTFGLAVEYPSSLRASWEFGNVPGSPSVSVCATGDRGWRKQPGQPATDLALEELNDLRNDVYGVFASTLVALTEPETKLAPGGRSKVGGENVVGLKLSRRPFPEVTLYFDEKTYLLRKMTYRGREKGLVVVKEMVYGGYKETGGLMLPTTQSTWGDGKKAYDLGDIQFTFMDRTDDKTFEKPKE